MEDQAKLDAKVANWLAWDKNEETRACITAFAEKKNYTELAARMNGRLLFGTAGIRARMDAGFACLNDLTIIQITHGFAKHLLSECQGKKLNGVAIGYDGRHNSKRFAHLASNVFIRNGVPVYLFSDVCPTPNVSWATIALKCNAGLIITASHNPKQDNGYKAYWSNGAQAIYSDLIERCCLCVNFIIGPHDTEIVRIAESEPKPKDEYWDISELSSNPLLKSANSTIDPYFEIEKSLIYHKEINEATPLKFTYSAFHGVGYSYAKRMFKEFGFPENHFISVKEQEQPDPDFPTVPFPNPEEGQKVLTLSFKTADAHESSVILANDPDADRIQLAEKQPSGQWHVFTGNEMGALLTWWVWSNWHKAHPDVDKSNVYVLNSAVSSQIVRTIAETEGFKSDVTLTGFKWMGNRADELRSKGKHVILAWEESIGYMPGHTLDKDGVTAAGMYAEMAAWLHTQGKNMLTQLFDIYNKYGYHIVKSSYWFVPNSSVTKELFGSLRKDFKFPERIGSQAVKTVRDLTIGYDNSQPGNKPILPLSTSSEMITFNLMNGSIVTLRASGTEPKIKYYIELKTSPGKKESDMADVMKELDELEKAVVETLLRPKQFGLIPRK
ncbi:phosphoglucomutase/phosphomannomutase, alpha/beta/alpha domain II [Dictyocaulus viviparus]|uniref:Phosphoglucomutase/phosphomannomutase, alpha/beta/alpha domain II n=1 Tax=Dictyocaulus viviparus TaxID=29172 RepID=A0A0D8XAA3_DICVI|nr:phosphoglucomutase/phosphomannomutase, alpha/beta/alpha domain II [Dictyocaulus viviparus]